MKEYTLNDKSKNEIQGFITTQKESVYPTGNEDEKTEGMLWIVIYMLSFNVRKKLWTTIRLAANFILK